MRFVLLSLPLLAVLAGCAARQASVDTDVTEKLVGTWADLPEECATNPETITFTPDGQFMIVTRAKVGWATKTDSRKVFRYRILGRTNTYLRVALENESRLDKNGKPVVWHIIPVNADTFCWGRDDWRKGACTPPRTRCEI